MKDVIAVLTAIGLAAGIYALILAKTGEKWKFKK